MSGTVPHCTPRPPFCHGSRLRSGEHPGRMERLRSREHPGRAERLRSGAAAVGMAAAGGGEPDSDDGSEELVLTPLQLIRSLEQVVRPRDEPRGFLRTF